MVAAAVGVAGVALGDIELHFAWQAWYLATSTYILRGRRGTYRTGLAPVARLGWVVAVVAVAVCVAGVALGDIDRHFAILCVPGVVLGDMDVYSAWQAWHLSCWAGSGGALGLGLAPWSPPPLPWQAWHLVTSSFTLRGRRGTWRHRRAFCVAGVALIAVARLGWVWRRGRRRRLRGRHGTWRHRSSLCVPGVVLGDMDGHSAWQAWHLSCWAGSGGALGLGLAQICCPTFQ